MGGGRSWRVRLRWIASAPVTAAENSNAMPPTALVAAGSLSRNLRTRLMVPRCSCVRRRALLVLRALRFHNGVSIRRQMCSAVDLSFKPLRYTSSVEAVNAARQHYRLSPAEKPSRQTTQAESIETRLPRWLKRRSRPEPLLRADLGVLITQMVLRKKSTSLGPPGAAASGASSSLRPAPRLSRLSQRTLPHGSQHTYHTAAPGTGPRRRVCTYCRHPTRTQSAPPGRCWGHWGGPARHQAPRCPPGRCKR